MLHQMRNPAPQRAGAKRRASEPPQLGPEPEALEVAAQTRAAIRKEEQIAVVKHALQVGKSIRTQHKMKNAGQFGSIEELEKYKNIAREARPKLEARMKALAERDELLDPQNIIHRRNPAGARATLMAMAYDEAAEEWEAECRGVQKRMRNILSHSVDEMAAVARGEDPEASLRGALSPKSVHVAAERARVVEGQRLATVTAMQTESAKLIDSWGHHNVQTLTILGTTASEFQKITRALLDGMGETETEDLEELLGTIENCMDEVNNQRSQLVEDAQGIAEQLHSFIDGGSSAGDDDATGEKPKSKLELRVQKLQAMLEERIERELGVMADARSAQEAVGVEMSRQKEAEWKLEQIGRQSADVSKAIKKAQDTLAAEKDRKQQVTLKLGAVMNRAPIVTVSLAEQQEQVVEQAPEEPLRVAIWRSRARQSYGLALDPGVVAQIIELTAEGTSGGAAEQQQRTEALQEQIVSMLGQGYSPVVKDFNSSTEQDRPVSSALLSLRKQVAQEDRVVSELARQVKEKGKAITAATSLRVASGGGGGGGGGDAQSPRTPEVLRRMTEGPRRSLP